MNLTFPRSKGALVPAPLPIPKAAKDILAKPWLAHFVTLMKDGSPQVTPVWVDYEGGHILVNSAEGRLKSKNVRRDPRVAISIVDPQNPYAGLLQVRGTVVEVRSQGADAHIDKLAKKYLGKDRYPWRQPGETRLLFVIRPDRVTLPSA
ncbi:MAG: PPOX class F420-dependent oxidoreductase [Chloroflexi bacterium]|nr:PPOX class F420-dependent oxidoreductase [Chloroflexota bacterium]